MQTFLYPNDLLSKEPISTWILTGVEPVALPCPFSADKPPYSSPRYAMMELNRDVDDVERWRYKIKVVWMALHAYWAWCVGKPLISHQDFAFVYRVVQQADAEDSSLADNIFPLEKHCPNSWSPCRQANYSFIPSRYPEWLRTVMLPVPVNPVMPWNDRRADSLRHYRKFYT